MPRANRHHLPGLVWHLTHRCHKREYLLKFARDRRRWRRWLYEARKRLGLVVLDYIATSNHVHLLVMDTAPGVIARSMQLIAGRTGQEFNARRNRNGAFWEDRYHATAVERDEHLIRCIAYIDLNMVRAGAVESPHEWEVSGFNEIQEPPHRYRIIDRTRLATACGLSNPGDLSAYHRVWVELAKQAHPQRRDPTWSESVAVGSARFTRAVQHWLGPNLPGREIHQHGDAHVLKEASATYRIEA